jgi:hypothetical protein
MENVPELPEENENRDNTEAEEMNARFIAVSLIVAMVFVGVSSADIHEDFQDYYMDGWGYSGSTLITTDTYPENVVLRSDSGSTALAGYNTPDAFNYFTFTCGQTVSGTTSVNLYSSSFALLGSYATGCAAGRVWEFKRDSSSGAFAWWYNGVRHAGLSGTLATPPYYAFFSGSGGGTEYVDNVHYKDDSEKYYMSTIPPNYSVVRDFLNPAASGLYACTPAGVCPGTSVRTTYMYSRWSQGNNSVDTSMSLAGATLLKNYNTGTIYETLGRGETYAGITRNNLSVLTSASATDAPDGLYTISLTNGSGPYNTAYFWLISNGATISFDQTKYYSDETGTATWTISPAYWSTSTYDYQGQIVDAFGSEKKSWTITSITGSENTDFDAATYPQGGYYVQLKATQKASPYTSYIFGSDYADIYEDIIISGITYNATRNATRAQTFINFTQLGTVTNTTSFPTTGAYNKTGFIEDQPITIEPVYKPLWFVPVSFTPLTYGNFTINLYGTWYPPNWTWNSTIYGLVQSGPYYNAIPSATVNIWNNTYTGSTTTNSTGHYNVSGLLPFSLYWMNATMPGYTNSTDTQVNSSSYYNNVLYSADRQDFLLSELYTLTITFKDSDTGATVNNVTIVDSDGYQESVTGGTFTHSYPYSLMGFTFTSDGYTTETTSYLMDEDRDETIYLSPETAPVSNIYYTPWQVRFQIVDYYQNPLPGTNVTASYIASTLPSTDISWLVNAFGISSTVASEMVDSGYAMGGQTDDNGGISFTMFKSIAYNLSIINSTSGVNVAKILYPTDQEYRIRVPLSSQVAPNNSLEQRSGTKLPVYQLNASCYNLSVVYSDTSGLTTNVVMEVIAVPNRTRVYTYNFGNPNVATVVHNYTVCHQAIGSELRWQYSATRSGT